MRNSARAHQIGEPEKTATEADCHLSNIRARPRRANLGDDLRRVGEDLGRIPSEPPVLSPSFQIDDRGENRSQEEAAGRAGPSSYRASAAHSAIMCRSMLVTPRSQCFFEKRTTPARENQIGAQVNPPLRSPFATAATLLQVDSPYIFFFLLRVLFQPRWQGSA